MMDYSYKAIQQTITDHSKNELIELAEQYIHHDRNRKIFLDRMLEHPTVEELSEKYDITTRRCFDILRECSRIVFRHMIP